MLLDGTRDDEIVMKCACRGKQICSRSMIVQLSLTPVNAVGGLSPRKTAGLLGSKGCGGCELKYRCKKRTRTTPSSDAHQP